MKLQDVILDELVSTKFQESGYSVVGSGTRPTKIEGYSAYILISNSTDVFVVDIRKLEI